MKFFLKVINQAYGIFQMCGDEIFYFTLNHTSITRHDFFVFKSSFFVTHVKSQTNYYCIVLAETYVATESLVLSKYYRGGNAKLDKKIGVKP